MKLSLVSCLILFPWALLVVATPLQGETLARPKQFVHPGILHTQDDFDRMKQQVEARAEPWWSGSQRLAQDRHSLADWQLAGPVATVTRGRHGADRQTNHLMVQDSRAAYQNALMWAITRDRQHAEKAIEILNAWGQKLRTIQGHDMQLAAGLNGFLLINAAEIMRHCSDAWQPGDVAQFEAMVLSAIYPSLQDFAPFANGNWDAACIKTMLAIGVFCENREIFEQGVDYYLHGSGNGRITHYVINEQGQCQESGRDQQHAQLGLGCLAEACEVAWHQKVDLFAAADNRLLQGYEYTARYLLGEEVPFEEHTDVTGKYHHIAISTHGRHHARPVFEIAFAHYCQRQGLEMPYTKKLLEQHRPEGEPPGADHPGFGTLTFFLGETE